MDDRVKEEFARLVETVARLRGEGGCPWDRQQTHDTLKQYVIEETYEVIEAIDGRSAEKLRDELGDLMLQVLLHAQIARESGEFDIADVCRRLREKLLRRHPHVFADVQVSGVDDVLYNWEQIKRTEPGSLDRASVLDGVPKTLPALMRAAVLSRKAARVGFDWPDVDSILAKLREETQELREALERGERAEIEEEIGDLLFTVVNIARFSQIDPEEALRRMLGKFVQRFAQIEARAEQGNLRLEEMSIEEMDAAWNQAKRDDSTGGKQ